MATNKWLGIAEIMIDFFLNIGYGFVFYLMSDIFVNWNCSELMIFFS